MLKCVLRERPQEPFFLETKESKKVARKVCSISELYRNMSNKHAHFFIAQSPRDVYFIIPYELVRMTSLD